VGYDIAPAHYAPPRPEGDMSWGPESGPPPFPGPVNYQLGFPQEPPQAGEEWRQEH